MITFPAHYAGFLERHLLMATEHETEANQAPEPRPDTEPQSEETLIALAHWGTPCDLWGDPIEGSVA